MGDEAENIVVSSRATAQKQESQPAFSEQLQQEYAYIAMALDLTNQELKARLTRLQERVSETKPKRPMPAPSNTPVMPLSHELSARCRIAAEELVQRLDEIAKNGESPTDSVSVGSDNKSGDASRDPTKALITTFTQLLLMIKNSAARSLYPHDFDSVLSSVDLTSEKNRGLLRRV